MAFRLASITVLPATLLATLTFTGASITQAQIIDRVVAIVGRRAVTASEIDLELRIEALLKNESASVSNAKRRQTLERLIDRRLVEQEMAPTNFLLVRDNEVDAHIEYWRQERFIAEGDLGRALVAYRVERDELREYWRQQLNLLRFTDFRFKTGLDIGREDVERYYQDELTPTLREEGASAPPPLETVYDQIERILINRRVEPMVDVWLKEVRSRTRVVIVAPSFRASSPN